MRLGASYMSVSLRDFLLIGFYRWVYLVFFNVLWVIFPVYAIHVAYTDIKNAFMVRNGVIVATLSKGRKDDRKNK